jgi:hypothetical protein
MEGRRPSKVLKKEEGRGKRKKRGRREREEKRERGKEREREGGRHVYALSLSSISSPSRRVFWNAFEFVMF